MIVPNRTLPLDRVCGGIEDRQQLLASISELAYLYRLLRMRSASAVKFSLKKQGPLNLFELCCCPIRCSYLEDTLLGCQKLCRVLIKQILEYCAFALVHLLDYNVSQRAP